MSPVRTPSLRWRELDSNPRSLSGIGSRWRAKSSGKVPDTHSLGAIRNHNLGVFTVTESATPGGHCGARQRCGFPAASLEQIGSALFPGLAIGRPLTALDSPLRSAPAPV
jgi:hypothetical protein